MEHFPFQEIVGLIVFVIVILAQFWTKFRTGKPMPGTEEPEPEFEFPDFGEKKPPSPGTVRPATATPARTPDDALREALGLPVSPRPQPPPTTSVPQRPAAPPVISRVPTPTLPAQPLQPLTPAPRPTPRVLQPSDEGAETGGVLASLERLEQETEFVRARLKEIGRLDVSAGAGAEAKMRQRLAHLVQGMGLVPAATAPAPAAESPIRALLADRNSIRRAIVLNEVLGPPRALRAHGQPTT